MIAGVALWFGTVAVTSATGVLARLGSFSPPPAAILTTLISVALCLGVPGFRRYLQAVGPRRLTAFHVVRVPAAMLFFWYQGHHLLPASFTQTAGWGDIAAGAFSFAVALMWPGRVGLLIANVTGMLDFISAFTVAIRLTLADPSQTHAILGFPAALIPFFAVGFLAATHLVTFRLLFSAARASVAGSQFMGHSGVTTPVRS